MTILAPALFCLLQVTTGQDPRVEWFETRFDRVHLRNGRFVDGKLLKSTPEAVILQIRTGELAIDRVDVDRVERVMMRNVREKTAVVPAPVAAPPAVEDPRPVAVVPSAVSPDVLDRVDAVLARAAAARETDQSLVLEELSELGDAGAVGLAERLPSMSARLLPLAGSFLARARSSAALPVLRAHVANGPSPVRREAAMALAETAQEEAVADLLPLLRDRDAHVRAAGIAALERAGSPRALEDVAALGADPDARVREKAYALAFKWAEAHRMRERLHEALVRALDGSRGRARAEVVRALSAASPEQGIELVAKALWDPEKEARSAAAVAVADADPERVGPSVVQRLADETEKEVRLRLAAAAERLKVEGAVEPLIRWLSDEDEQVRRAAASVLQTLTRRNYGLDAAAWKAWHESR